MTLDTSTRWDQQLQSLRQLAHHLAIDTVVLKDPLNLSWFTGARWHVPQTLNLACFDVVIEGLRGGSPGVRVVTNAIEAQRLRDTELAGTDAVFDVVGWTEDRATRLPSGPTVAVDQPLAGMLDASAELAALRRVLNPSQRRRLGDVSADVARITGRIAASARPGQTENHVAGQLVAALLDENIECVALFVGSDNRIADHRHPLASEKAVERRLMLACCGRRNGMVASVTRMVTFAPLGPAALHYRSLLEVERRFLDLSQPGANLRDVFTQGVAAYAENGFDPDEWHRHHQGGLTGYNPRELIANPTSDLLLTQDMALAWNPSGLGFKVEDTVLVGDGGPTLLATDDGWPSLTVGGRVRPDVLEL